MNEERREGYANEDQPDNYGLSRKFIKKFEEAIKTKI